MRMMTFAKRCGKEILRDLINLGFGLGLVYAVASASMRYISSTRIMGMLVALPVL